MDRNDIVCEVIQAVTQVQEASGRRVEGISPNTRPFKDVQDFDSLCGVEATVLLSEALGPDLPDSVFAPEQGSRALSITEIADGVLDCMSKAQVT